MTGPDDPGLAVDPDDTDAIAGSASEGACVKPGTPGQQSTSDSPWWRSLQEALGKMLR